MSFTALKAASCWNLWWTNLWRACVQCKA